MKAFPPVPSCLSAQMISLLVLMARNVFMNHYDVMEDLIVKMNLMNLSPFVLLHVQMVCLPVPMVCNVFLNQKFAMGFLVG